MGKKNYLVSKIASFLLKQLSLEDRNKLLISSLKKKYSHKDLSLDGNTISVKNKAVKPIVRKYKCDLGTFFRKMRKYIVQTDIVLDIGCGLRPQTFFEPVVHICIEPYKEYRQILKPFFPNKSYIIYIKSDGIKGLEQFDDNSVDSIFLIDVIEHLDKADGIKLLQEADRVARKQIVVFTPYGFYPMHYSQGDSDAWGLSGTEYQTHRSGWLPKDFGRKWSCYVCLDCHPAFLPEEKLKNIKYSALMAIKTKEFNGFTEVKNTPTFVKDSFYNDTKNRI